MRCAIAHLNASTLTKFLCGRLREEGPRAKHLDIVVVLPKVFRLVPRNCIRRSGDCRWDRSRFTWAERVRSAVLSGIVLELFLAGSDGCRCLRSHHTAFAGWRPILDNWQKRRSASGKEYFTPTSSDRLKWYIFSSFQKRRGGRPLFLSGSRICGWAVLWPKSSLTDTARRQVVYQRHR
jgi:hypothetical protein